MFPWDVYTRTAIIGLGPNKYLTKDHRGRKKENKLPTEQKFLNPNSIESLAKQHRSASI